MLYWIICRLARCRRENFGIWGLRTASETSLRQGNCTLMITENPYFFLKNRVQTLFLGILTPPSTPPIWWLWTGYFSWWPPMPPVLFRCQFAFSWFENVAPYARLFYNHENKIWKLARSFWIFVDETQFEQGSIQEGVARAYKYFNLNVVNLFLKCHRSILYSGKHR